MTMEEDKIPNTGSREPYWDEMTDAQKIERLRYASRELQMQVNQIGDWVFLLAKHGHLDGRLCTEVPMYELVAYGNPFRRPLRDKSYL